ncbi:hypothetical protein LCGC14_1644830, partial [marine sediment metagenome]
MATVVRGFEDKRAANFGRAVGGFLSKLQERRLDKQQQQMLLDIQNATSEEEATAILADPANTKIMNDTTRANLIGRFLLQSHPDEQTITGFDKDNTQQVVSFNPNKTNAQQALADAGLSVGERRSFVIATQEGITGFIPGTHEGSEEAKTMVGGLREGEFLLDTTADQLKAFIDIQANERA